MTKKRAHGEGTIYKQPDGTWHGQLKLPNGKRKNVYGKKQKEVQEKLAVLRREIDAGLHNTTNSDQTLYGFVEGWLAHHKHRLRSQTFASYSSLLHNHFDTIGLIHLNKLAPIVIQDHYTRKLQSLSSSTVQHLHTLLHVSLKSAVKLGILPRNPTDFVDAPGLKSMDFTPLTETQAKKMLDGVRGNHYEAVYVLALATGMRVAELLGLRWSDVNWEQQRISVKVTLHRVDGEYVLEVPKSRMSMRTLPLPHYAVEVLQRHRIQQDEEKEMLGNAWGEQWGLIFTTKAGLPVHHDPLLRMFRRLIVKQGLLETTRLHDLRHTFATLLLEKGVHIKVVSELLGHSSVNITLAIYGHVTPRMQDNALNHLNALMTLIEES